MNLVVYINEHFEDEKALYDLDNNKILLKGDEYHDKIYAKIEGYLLALSENIEDIEEIWIDNSHEKFIELEFYYAIYDES